ncbi:CHAT domain-containing protein [Streptomyces sp. NBC_01142]|uniref:CHAT domain-containing protein n=1 Tax=Streptomyces sp. NBC_01142 TaxID=2975865 RepID=UPI00224F886B|nr:CHAT domain-containing protein [Streptomyces sp. NBC_01142]MCX4821062.1 CHAT domain-containing protein [Streptomyces sp. NBC_01142]
MDTLRLMAELARRGEVALAAEPLAALIREAQDLLIRWFAGERLTARADEAERRARAVDAWGGTGHDDPLALRLGALALLRLPPESERDLESARRRLLTSLELGRRADDRNEQLAAAYYLLKYELLSPEQSVALMDEACASLTGDERPSAVRDFLESAHTYCLMRAGEALMARDADSHTSWMERAAGLLGIALGEYERTELDTRTAGMVARHLDIAGDARRAAEIYGRLIDRAADPQSRTTQVLDLSHATHLGHLGEHESVRRRMAQFLPSIRDRYLTAVTEHDVAQAAFSFNRASALLAVAHVHCGEPEAALRVLEDSKSMRRRYRSELSRLPSHEELLALEQDILAATRAHEISQAMADSPPPAVPGRPISLRAQLLERYRLMRPDLTGEALRSPSSEEIAAALGPDEAAVILGVGDSATLVFYITRDNDRSRPALRLVCLPEWPWDRWQELLEISGGWVDALSGRLDSSASQAALRAVVPAVEAAIGRLVRDKIMRSGTRRLVVIPHRWLHFVPFRALPSLLDTPMSIYPSAREFVQSRARLSPPAMKTDLVVCDPTGDLPCSASEAGSVKNHHPPDCRSTVLVGPEATSSNVAEHLAQAGAFHFSGHGHADPQDPARSALLVAPSPEDVRAGDPLIGWPVRRRGRRSGRGVRRRPARRRPTPQTRSRSSARRRGR